MRTKRHELDEMIRKLEALGHRSPQAYKVRVALLAVLGFAYLFAVIAFLVAITVVLPILILITVLLVLLILRSLWVRVQAPEGKPLARDRAPRLFEVLEEIRMRLDCPKFHAVLLTDDFNASAGQTPRLGIFGWQKNYLILGLPYMMAFTPEQYRSILAHEAAHIFGADGRFGGWIHRVEQTWANLNQRINRQHWLSRWMLQPFFKRYSPYFSAHAFVLSRANEYAADRFAARLTCSKTTAAELLTAHLQSHHMNESFWLEIYKRASSDSEPTGTPYAEMREFLRRPLPDKAELWLKRELNRRTNTVDTHPSLSDRLSALGEAHFIPLPPAESAAEHFLGDALPGLIEEFDAQWRTNVSEWWKQRRQRVTELNQRCPELRKNLEFVPKIEDAWEYACAIEELESSEAALAHYERCLAIKSDHAHALYAVGRIKIGLNDDAGVALMERAADLDADYIFPATDTLYGYFMETGRHARAQEYYERAIRQNERIELANEERAGVTARDKLLPHGLKPAEIEALVGHLEKFSLIARVHLARKQVRYFPEKPMFVVAIVWRAAITKNTGDYLQRIANEVPVPFGYTMFYDVSSDRALRNLIARVPGSRIYKRPWFGKSRSGV